MPIKCPIQDSHKTGNVSINSLKINKKKILHLRNCCNGSTAFGLEAPA